MPCHARAGARRAMRARGWWPGCWGLVCCCCCLLGGGLARSACQPCAPDCACRSSPGPGPAAACAVDCAARGLARLPDLPGAPSAVSLNLSSNKISVLNAETFAHLTSLTKLDLSNNKISTLEDGVFDNLFNLSEINLSLNPFLCDCNLSWLPRWVERRKVKVVRPLETKCAQPAEVASLPLFNISFTDTTCGADYIACLTDNSTGSPDAVVRFVYHLPQNLTEEICSAHCYAEGQAYGGFSDEAFCLCGSALEPNSSADCLPFCTELFPRPVCGGPSIVSHVFLAQLPIALVGPSLPSSLHRAVTFNVSIPLAVGTFQWDFGDQAKLFNTTKAAVFHKYSSPGRYNVTATAFVGSQFTSAQTEIEVVAPPLDLELQCPPLVKTNESLQLRIRNRGGTGLSATYTIVSQDAETEREVHPMCPPDSVVFPGNSHCYRLVAEKAEWHEAQRHCQEFSNGDLAFVSSPEIQSFLVSRVTRSLDVWIGFNDLASPSPLQRGESFDLQSCQNWLPGEPHPSNADHCVRMGPAGQCNTDLCMAKHSYVCEYKPQKILLNTEHFLLGTPAFDAHTPMSNVTEKDQLSAPSRPVETMAFPSLAFQQRGFLVALEFVTQELLHTVQVRFQVHRPALGEDCREIADITEPSLAPPGNGTGLQVDCPAGLQWCSRTNTCLPLRSCCDPATCVNSSAAGSAAPGPCLHANHLQNRLLEESLFDVPPGRPTQYLLLFRGNDASIRLNDTVSIQHDAGPGAFLLCRPSSRLSDQISYLTTNSSTWNPGSPAHPTAGHWQNGSVCFLRVLYTAEETVPIIGQKNSGVVRHGLYTVRTTVDNGVFAANLSCNFWAVSPVLGLRVIYPAAQEGKIYVPTNDTWLVVKVSSGVNASAGWLGWNQSFPFERHCPPAVALRTAECARETNDSQFSVITLHGVGQNFTTIVLWAANAVSSQNISVVVKAEEVIRGLRATPDPETRVLLNRRVSYVPKMDAGSDVTFRWTVDDKPSFTFYNNVFNVVYQTPAVYKLSLTASNHVSNVTVNYNITVEKMNRMKDLLVSEIPSLVPQNSTMDLSAVVTVDSAVDATFSWDFGDGNQIVFQFMPPYNESFLVPDPDVHQVMIVHNVSHIYQEPGQYTLVVSVFNEFENLTSSTPVRISTYLSEVTMEVNADVLVVGHPVAFEAHPLPSRFGVSYAWDFDDGCVAFVEDQPTVLHSYSRKGMYNVTLRANNSISAVETSELYRVFEEIRGLRVTLNEEIELRTPVEINATVETGDNITWVFDMGDGTILESAVGSVKHIYSKEVNCTVNVTAVNPVNSVSQAVPVQIFVLMVLKIEPSFCIPEHPEVQLTAYVSGNPADYVFDWTFGDGSSNVTVVGYPTVTHNFTHSGDFPLSLVLSSEVNKAHYYTVVCVEPEITNVTLFRPLFVTPGNETRFQATALPPSNYRYLWDFGANDSARFGGTEASYTYKTPGNYLVTVTVSNNVSFNNVTAIVKVLEPVGVAKIESNGSKVLELNQIYLFSANVSGTNVSYLWDFGDGTSQLGKFITHSYNKTGLYSISLKGWNEVSHTEARLNVTVKRRLHGLAINASKTIVPLNGSVSFAATLLVGTALRYSWILCDRCTPIPGISTISYTFRSVGTFNVIVTAENEISSLQDSIFVHVLQQIEGLQVAAGDLVDSSFFPTNKTLQLQAMVREGTNISYNWSAQREGQPVQTGAGKAFSLLVTEAGVYVIHLKATNMLGSLAVNKTVEFIEQIGVLKPVASPNPAAVNVSINISTSVTAGTNVVYTWYLEEGVFVVTPDPFITYSFPSPGVKVITVTAENKFGSANATLLVCVQEPVVGLKIRTVSLDSSYIRSGSVVNFCGELERGTDVVWTWKMLDRPLLGQRVAHEFPTAGSFSICLNASNNVSWETACHNITVQDAVRGLRLLVSKEVVEPGEQVSFVIEMSSGSSVSYGVSIGGERKVALNASSFTHAFTQVGEYTVKVTAENHVSAVQVEVRVVVLEPVSGLRFADCCDQGTPTGVERHFTAEIEKGSQVSYLWQFSLEEERGHLQVVLEGKSVSYTPEAAGLLEIHLTAFNGLGSMNVSVAIHVQDPITQFSLKPIDPFANRTALFEASVFPSARQVVFWWHFGDGSPAQRSTVPSASHTYVRPGDYLVEVNATNLISFAITHLTVTVQVLECEEPEAELVLPAQVVMRRSQKNYLEAQIDLRGCFRYQTKYLWEIYRTSSCLRQSGANRVHLPAVDMTRPQLVVPKLALDLGNYCFKFSVRFGETPLSKSIFVNVTVAPNKLVPIIDGGSYRVWSGTRDLILDGEKSYDPNLEDGEQTPLNYRWSCVTSTKSSSSGCALNFSATGGGVTVSRALLEADVEYTFDLTVWKTGMNPEATNQTVLIKKGMVPIVALECVSCKAQSVYEVSRSSYVYLEGTCLNCQNNSKQGRWAAHSFKNRSLVLDRSTTSTGNEGMNLVLRPGALKDGEGYTFTFHITDLATGEEGYASMDLFPNQPPFGGFCRLSPLGHVQALAEKVHFECTGWRDNEDEDAPLVYILLATRCRTGHCEEFWVYKGSHSEHVAFLPPGFQEGASLVHISVLVQDQLGATVVALNSSLAITLPDTPDGFRSLPHWLYNQTDVVLQGLVKQNNPQQVIEYSLALITILNEYERSMHLKGRDEDEEDLRAWTRRNITKTLISMKVNTVDDIRQITAALAQCTVANKEFVCRACLTETLKKLESMLMILQGETLQGTMTPTSIADNILSIMGDLIHLVNTVPQPPKSQGLTSGPNPMQVASKAYALSTDLMRILMKSRVLNEEPLELVGGDIMAKGKRSDPFGLLCYKDNPSCRFSIPPAFNATFSDLADVVQVMIRVDYNPFPFGYIPNYTISSEVASMEFQSSNGTEIPVGRLDSEKAITVMVSDPGAKNITAGTITVEERKSVNVVLTTESSNREAGLYFQVTFSVLNDRYVSQEPEPFVAVYLHHSPQPSEYNCTASKKIRPEDMSRMAEGDPRRYTFFVSAVPDDAARDYYLNITNHFLWSPVEVTLGLYSSLCQYFSEEEERWKTEGMTPLEGATPHQAMCLTQHLTAFGASLFVPPHSVRFIRPPPGPGLNYIVLLTCAICFVTYSVAAVIVHKLDLIDISRVGVIPFCGKNGLYKYEILVKTGWGTGSGTTAHVGITLYGMDNKSGHRHLDHEDAFHRNSLDIFQIATEQSLGTLWKIRIWHDNKGLSPSWYLQHVIVRDLQTSKSFYFLVNDWLSVESEENNGLVEREVFAASEADLRSFLRIFMGELQRGFFEKHIWLSLWDRPPRSRFTRVQRASCCCLLVFLFLCANAVWYGVVGDVNFSNVAVSTLIPVSFETVTVGLVSSLVVYPLYLVLLFLFRMARSKVSVSHSLTHSDQQSLEIDNYLDSSLVESSFLTFPGLRTEAFSEQTKTDVFLDDCKSLIRWHSSEALPNWPDLLSDPSIMGNTIQKLKRGRTSRHLGLEAPLATEEDGLSLGFPQAQGRHFSTSDEDLIRQILTDGTGNISHSQDVGQYPRVETDLISGLYSMLGEKTEAIMLQRLNAAAPGRELNCSAKSTRTVADHALRKHLLPFWCSHLAHAFSLTLLAVCFGVSAWIGVTFTSSVALMWLISGIFSFLSSFLFWEPLKVLLEAFYFSLAAKRLHPEEDDTLVEYPLVEHVSEKVSKVRPPQGFALFQAKEEARKVKLLHRMLKNFLIYMLFLLATLLTNYGDASHNSRAFLLQSSIKRQMASEQFLRIKRPDEFWVWMSQGLLPYLYNNQSGSGSQSTTLGAPRLRQIRLQEAGCLEPTHSGPDPSAARQKCAFNSDRFDTSSYAAGWKSISDNLTQLWSHSPPEFAGVRFWGSLSFYDSGGYVQELGTTLEESRARLDYLQQNSWISNRTRAVFVELTQYNPSLALLAVVTLRLEFLVAGHAVPAVTVGSVPSLLLNRGVTLQLLMMVILMIVVVYFVVSESLSIKKMGRAYFALARSYSQWSLILLSTCTVAVYVSQATLAGRQWATYLKNRQGFTSFYQVALLNTVFSCLAASLLFFLTVKASQQLRFIRQWSTFGRTLRRSVKELLATALVFVVLTLAYAQLGFLLFSSRSESFCTFSGALQLLFTALHSSVNLRRCLPEPVGLPHLFCASYVALELWVLLRLFATVLIHHYRETRFEMYRPAFESQDYEMVELFVRRLKMWMGVSKVKEFRHKVRFEGMEPLPSRSSSQDSRSLQGPTPSAVSDSASTSSSQLDGLSLALSTQDSCEVDGDVQHLLSLLEILLVQFDRVNKATQEVYRIELQLECTRSGRVRKRGAPRAEQPGHQHRPTAADLGSRSPPTDPRGSPLPPSHPLSGSAPGRIAQASHGVGVASSLLSPHKTYASLAPAARKKKKPLRANNRVHPSGK